MTDLNWSRSGKERAIDYAKCATFAKRNATIPKRMRKAGKQEGRKMALEHEALTEQIIGAAIVELKAIKIMEDIHFAVASSYLRPWAGNTDCC